MMPEITESQKETLSLFSSGTDKLEKAVAGLSEEQLDYSIAPGEWSIRQIIHHVATDGDAWSLAFQTAIASPGVPIRFEGFPGNEKWADALAFDKRPVTNSLALLKTHRYFIAELAEHFPDAWEAYVTILDSDGKELQKVMVGQIIRMLAEHLEEHLATIEAIKQQHD